MPIRDRLVAFALATVALPAPVPPPARTAGRGSEVSATRLIELAGLVLAGCASRAKGTEASARAPAESFGLPPVRAALDFPPGSHDVTLAWLVAELARLSGQELAVAQDLQGQFEASPEPLEGTAPVPAGEVHSFVEVLLHRQGYRIAPVSAGTRPVLGIHGTPERGGVSRPVPIEREQVAALAGHPALYGSLLLTLENIDSRQLLTQLRQLMGDPGQHQHCIATGERSLLIQASGAKLAGRVEVLLAIDRAAASRAPADLESKWPTVPRVE